MGNNSAAPLTSIDLFAGCGGLSLGFHRAGWRGVFAVERDPMAFETLKANLVGPEAPYRAYEHWPEWLDQKPLDVDEVLGDPEIRARLMGLRDQVDLIAGGPPCQGFSVGGSRNGLDERNEMVQRQLEFVELVRPRAVIVENVEGIARAFRSRPGEEGAKSVAHQVVLELDRLGYDAKFGVADTSRFGVPQVRRRALIVGIRRDLGVTADRFFDNLEAARPRLLEQLGLDPERPVTAGEALSDLTTDERVPSPDSPKFESSPYLAPRSTYARLMRRGSSRSVPDSHRYSKHGERVQALYDLAHATQPKGRLSKEFLLSNGTKKDKKVLIDETQPVSTITTHPDEFIHYAEARNVTVREMARLQSFPDDFEFKGRYTINGPRRRFDVARCSQVGNAVPPHFAEAVGMAMAATLAEAGD